MMITGTRWFHNGTSVTTQNSTAPYQINTTLYINQPFTADRSHTGTYTSCSPNNMATDPSRDTIDLIAAREYLLT